MNEVMHYKINIWRNLMPRHEFGILEENQLNNIFTYSPEEYNCITIDDDFVLPLVESFKILKTYHHNFDRPNLGLAYCGITIIPIESLSQFQEILVMNKQYYYSIEYTDLIGLVTRASQDKKNIIHFGV